MAKRRYFEEGKTVGKGGIRGWGLHFGVSVSVSVLNLVCSMLNGRGCGIMVVAHVVTWVALRYGII